MILTQKYNQDDTPQSIQLVLFGSGWLASFKDSEVPPHHIFVTNVGTNSIYLTGTPPTGVAWSPAGDGYELTPGAEFSARVSAASLYAAAGTGLSSTLRVLAITE